ncbi:tape measure protein [Salinicoccus sp. HZC-1]|uniref:tape measure protein n=1 Tax=Salinicoccus sp. HZC-1 TaxID=3385497 RepID=UPI00398B4B6A
MADRIQGLSIGLGMDSTEISRSMSEIKRSFRGLNSAAKITTNNFKYGAKDVNSYKKNLASLSDTTEKQRKNVDALGKRYSAVVEEQGASSKAAQTLAAEYNKQADSLNRLEHQLKAAEDGLRGVYDESSRLSKIGDTFGGISKSLGNVGSSLQNVGSQIKDVGGSLTRNITLPASAAALAVGGLTAKFGWDRLVGLDSAQAQLKGLGYSTEEVGKISDQVTSAIEGGMTTMAEGTSVAAGALAAGVEEGAELEKYIKLVGDAAVGANRPVNEMATIFNRVQGTGQLMTGELNQVEDSLPGFSQAMADHLGVSYEKMREMVTAGEVTSNDFITVMDGFAGDMAAAYSDSWAGMVANTKAYIGIIGENLLGGVFEQSKASIAEFIDFLKSDEVVEWAKTTGAAIGETFSNIVTKVQEGITWFKNLDTEQQKLIGKLALVAVAAGPLLTVFGAVTIFVGKVVSVFAGLFGGLSTLFGWFGKLSGGIQMMIKEGKSFAQVFPKLSKVITPIVSIFSRFGSIAMTVIRPAFTAIRIALVALTGPVGIVIGVISALAAGFVFAYKRSETFRNFIDGLRDKFMQGIEWITKFKDGILGLFKDEGDSGIDILTSIGLSDGMVQRLWDISGKFMEFYHKIKGGITGIIDMFKGDWMGGRSILERVGFTPDQILGIENFVIKITYSFHLLKERIGTALSAVKGVFTSIFNAITAWWDANGPAIIGAVTGAFQRAKNLIGQVWSSVSGAFMAAFNFIRNWWASNGQAILGAVVSGFQWMKETAGLVINLIVAVIRRAFIIGQTLFNTFSTVVSFIWSKLWNVLVEAVRIFAPIVQGIWNTLWSVIKNTIQIFAPIISGIVKTAINIITETFRIFKPIVMGIWNTLWPILVNVIQGAWSRMKLIVGIGMDLIQGIIKTATAILNGNWSRAWEMIRQTVSSIKDRIVTHITGMKNRAIALIQQLAGGAIQWFQNMWTNLTNKATDLKNRVVYTFNSLKLLAESKIREMVANVVRWFINLYNRVSNTVTDLKNRAARIFNSLRDLVVGAVTTLRDRLVRGFTRIYNTIRDKMQAARDKAVSFATSMKDGAINQFNNLADGARDMMNKVGEWIDNKKQWVVDKATSLGTGIANAAIGGFNKMIGGINNVAGMLGFDGNLISKIPTYSTGTKNHKGGAAIVGDKGPGNGPGGGSSTRELIELPNKKRYLADGNLLIPNLPRGAKVFNNRDTEGILGSGSDENSGFFKTIGDFAKNTYNSAKEKVSGAFNSVKGFVSDIWDYATDPGALVGDLISKLDFGWDLPDAALDFAKLGVNKLKTVATDFIKNLFEESGGQGDGSHILGKSTTQTFGRYSGGLSFNGGRHYGVDTAHVYDKLLSPVSGVITKIWKDFGGGNSIQMKAGKYNWWFMHMKSIAKKVGDSIKAGDTLGVTGNTGNFTTGPHLHTQVMEGGVGNKYAIDPVPILKGLTGYATGGLVGNGIYRLGEGGYPEYVIPTDPSRATEAMKLIALAGKDVGNKRPNQLPNVGGSEDNDNDVVNALVEQNGILMKMLEKLTGIEAKDLSIGDEEIGRSNDRYNQKKSTKHSLLGGRPSYV